MINCEQNVTFRVREFKGSRLRCLLLTSQGKAEAAAFLNSLVHPIASVSTADHWAPRGFLEPLEAKLGETPNFLSEADRKLLTSWWLARPGRANTPNWDVACTCQIDNRRGLLLVEAKAHEAEVADDRGGAKHPDNLEQIAKALSEATDAWNGMVPGHLLSANTHYQLSNRFGFAWKVAKLKIPVVLVYLGFLNAQDMESDNRVIFKTHDQWRRCLLDRSSRTIPAAVWDKTFSVDGTPLTILIRSAIVGVSAMTSLG